MKKKIIFIILVVIILVSVIFGIYLHKNKKIEISYENCKIQEDGNIINISQTLNQEKIIEGLLINNIQLLKKDNKSFFIFDITNTNNYISNPIQINISFLGNDDKNLGNTNINIETLEINQKVNKKIETDLNIVIAKDVIFSKI